MNHIALTDSQRRTLLLAENFLLLVLVGAGGLLGNWIATTTAGGQYAVVGALVGGGVTLVFGQTANSLVHEVVAGQMLDPLAIIQLLLQNATNQVAQAIAPQPQASVTVTTTTPPPATSSDSTTITATAGDVSAPIAPVTPDVPATDSAPTPKNTPSTAETGDTTQNAGTGLEPPPQTQPGAENAPVAPARFVTDDAGNRYQLVPASSV